MMRTRNSSLNFFLMCGESMTWQRGYMDGRWSSLRKERPHFLLLRMGKRHCSLRFNPWSQTKKKHSRVILYCNYGKEQGYDHVQVKSLDSDIFFILLHYANSIQDTTVLWHRETQAKANRCHPFCKTVHLRILLSITWTACILRLWFNKCLQRNRQSQANQTDATA